MKESKPYTEKKFIAFLIGAFGFLVLDFLSKWLVQIYAPYLQEVEVIKGFFYIYKSYNTGVAFSLGASLPTWLGRTINIAISVVMSALIFVYWFKNRKKITNWHHASGMLLLSGAVGNFIDRAFYWVPVENGGPFGVIDFLRFYIFGKSNDPFATFNIADACLTVGVAMLIVILIVDTVKSREKDFSEAPKQSQDITHEQDKGDE